PEAQKVLDFLAREFPKDFKKIRFGTKDAAQTWQGQLEAIGAPKRDVGVEVGIGIKPVSYLGTERLVHSEIRHAIKEKRKGVTLVQKGKIMKFPGGAFQEGGYGAAKHFFGGVALDGGPGQIIKAGAAPAKPQHDIVIKDAIADITLQQV